MAALGVFDTSYFPEISDDRSSYQSPLKSINQKLRRKNVVAAAAVSGPNMSLYDSSDPWNSAADSFGGYDPHDEPSLRGFCACTFSKRRDSWALGDWPRFSTVKSVNTPTQQQRRTSSTLKDSKPSKCTRCGKRLFNPSDLAWGRPRSHRLHSTKAAATPEGHMEDPQHAKALLQATPKLRHLSASSSDVQGGRFPSSRNLLNLIIPPTLDSDEKASSSGNITDYKKSLVRDRANQQAASELASLLFSLFHEMSLEDYGTVESEVFTSVFALVHDTRKDYRMAGLAALDALIVVEAPSADEEKKGIKFANALSNGLRSAHGDFEFLSAVSKALGHMALRTANVDFVESEVTRALEWLRTERSDRRYV